MRDEGGDIGKAGALEHGNPFRFYTGLHQPSDAKHFKRACISINRLQHRKAPIGPCKLIVDSGSFTTLALHGCYLNEPSAYAAQLIAVQERGTAEIEIAVAQDFMCEAFMLAKTGMDIAQHQRLTIERYDALLEAVDGRVLIMPVLQGYHPSDYARHADAYGDRLQAGQWVGVGSVCKRNGTPEAIVDVLETIHHARPGLELHGFGVKRTSLLHAGVRAQLQTADSMAWSFAARKQGRNANAWQEAKAFEGHVMEAVLNPATQSWQMSLPL